MACSCSTTFPACYLHLSLTERIQHSHNCPSTTSMDLQQEFCKSKLLYHQCTAVKTFWGVAPIKHRCSCMEPGATTPSQISLLVFSEPPLRMALPCHSVWHLPRNSTMHIYCSTISLERESRTKPSRAKQQPWLNTEMHRRLSEISRGNKGRLFSHYTFILNEEALGWEAAGELPQSAEWKTASVTRFQIRHQEADSSPRPRETTLTKIYTAD